METGNTAIVARRYELCPNMVNRLVKEYKKEKYDEMGTGVWFGPLKTKKLS
jgi:transposase